MLLGKLAAHLAGFQVQFNGMGAVQPRLVHKASRRIDMAGGTDGDKNIRVGQRALPLHADSRPILFLLCLFVGTGSALCLLLAILALLCIGQIATGGVRIYGPMLLLLVLWKPLNWVVGIIDDFLIQRAEKGKGKGQRDGGRR